VYGHLSNKPAVISAFSAFPRLLEKSEKLTTRRLLHRYFIAKRFLFRVREKFCLPGTGEEYGEQEGKASVSTNDWIQGFWTENGWIMIQYAISRDHMPSADPESARQPRQSSD
jgi:hypothetical protein